MMPVGNLAERRLSVEEYSALEERSEEKHEFYDGQVFSMTGATWNHNQLTKEIVRQLSAHEDESNCRVASSDQRVLVADGLYTYPDCLVVCGKPEFLESEQLTLTNPTVIFEVLSKSTMTYDLTTKARKYRATASLQEYVVLWQTEVRAMHQVRMPRQTAGETATAGFEWTLGEFESEDDVLTLRSVGLSLRLGDLYRTVDLPAAPPLRDVSDQAPSPQP